MGDRVGSELPVKPLRFVRTEGSNVSVGHKDKAGRVREAMIDLQLAIDGCIAQQSDQLSQSIAALARACSIFLRKMVIGDRGDRRTRLLDDDICQMAKICFDRIRRVPKDRRTLLLVPVDTSGGHIKLTKLSDETLEPEVVHLISVGSQRLEIAIEWPLPGMVDWLSQPTADCPWEIRIEGLFALPSNSRIGCDAWLGQQLVMFDNRGITLKDVIRVTANTEGAHSSPVSALSQEKGKRDEARRRVAKDSDIHILRHITICGVRYSHAIVIESALYLYHELARNSFFEHTEGGENILVFRFVPDDVFSPDQHWLNFDGGLTMSLDGAQQFISHRVRAPR